MLSRIRWPNVAAALLVTVVLLAVVAWPALEPAPPRLPPGPATAIRPAAPTATPAPPPPRRTGHEVPGGFERQATLAPQARGLGILVGRAWRTPAPMPTPTRPRHVMRPTPAPVAAAPVATAAPVYAPRPAYVTPPRKEFGSFEKP